MALPAPLAPRGVRFPDTRAKRFDDLVAGLADRLERRWGTQWGAVEFGVEETPLLPSDWSDDDVPLATLVPAAAGRPARIVVFRRPVERRVEGRAETSALVLALLVERVAELLGRAPQEIDPRYEG
ncbi:MAG: metallopeptidase family protein [Actinomycetota bacterium]|nr:metallopeptidase family protein [Actinomycetota bacterium]